LGVLGLTLGWIWLYRLLLTPKIADLTYILMVFEVSNGKSNL
jgi:hypothetical protein